MPGGGNSGRDAETIDATLDKDRANIGGDDGIMTIGFALSTMATGVTFFSVSTCTESNTFIKDVASCPRRQCKLLCHQHFVLDLLLGIAYCLFLR